MRDMNLCQQCCHKLSEEKDVYKRQEDNREDLEKGRMFRKEETAKEVQVKRDDE